MQEVIRWSDSRWLCVDDYIRVQLSVWLQVLMTIPARSNHRTIRIFKLEMTTTKISSKPKPTQMKFKRNCQMSFFFFSMVNLSKAQNFTNKGNRKKETLVSKNCRFLSPRLPLRVAKFFIEDRLLISAAIGRDRKTVEKGRDISAHIRSFLHRKYLPQFRPTLQIQSTAVFLALFSGPDLQHKGFCIPCQMYPPLPCLPCEGDDVLYRTRHEQGRF